MRDVSHVTANSTKVPAIQIERSPSRSSSSPRIVTLVGWITLIKSLLFLFLPPQIEAGLFLKRLHCEQLFYLYGAFSLVLGVYLTYGGFKSRLH